MLFRTRTKVYGDQQDDAGRESQGQEDWHEKVCRGCAEWEIVTKYEKYQGDDCCAGDSCEYIRTD